jgi:hypothetical protein
MNFKHILLGQCIRVYTDHLNLTNGNFNTKHVMHWHLILKLYSRELLYIKGEKNIVANALSRLPIATSETEIDNSDPPTVFILSLITLVYMTVIYRMRYIRYYVNIYKNVKWTEMSKD